MKTTTYASFVLCLVTAAAATAQPVTPRPSPPASTHMAPPASTRCPPGAVTTRPPFTPAPHSATRVLPRNPDEHMTPEQPMQPKPPQQDLPPPPCG